VEGDVVRAWRGPAVVVAAPWRRAPTSVRARRRNRRNVSGGVGHFQLCV